MDDEGSKRKKKKRGKSLIFKKCFRLPSSRNRGKVLASDDNLIYCDANGNCEPEIKKATSSRVRVSRAFKAVLFDTAMKKKMGRKKSSKPKYESENTSPVREEETEIMENLFNESDMDVTKEEGTSDSENSSPGRDEKPETIENSLDENKSLETGSSSNGGSNAIPTSSEDNNSNDAKKLETGSSSDGSTNVIPTSSEDNNSNDTKKLETGSSSNDSSNVIVPKSLKENNSSDESQVASSSTSSTNVDSQILTERKITARVNSMKKKPPLPSKSKSSVKTNPASDSECGTLDNATYHWCLIVGLAVFILVVYWMS